ncbi:MAG: FHA domain-containing protein [Anaerolineae bacterium]
MVQCPYGEHQIDDSSKICPICGRILTTNWSQTRALAEAEEEQSLARFGTSFFNDKMTLHLRIRGENKTFSIEAETMKEIVLGRGDPATGTVPTIDLGPYEAIEKGVSRKHAQIIRREDNALHLIDLASGNGTYLNGQRLIPNQPRILRNGDEIRLGRLVMMIEFTKRSGRDPKIDSKSDLRG